MAHTPVRRVFAGLAVATAVLGSSAAPAFAAPADITMFVPDVTVPVGADGALVSPIWWSDADIVVSEPKMVFRLDEALPGVSLSGEGVGDCENVSPRELVCTDGFEMEIGPGGISGWFRLVVTAEDGATVPGEPTGLTSTFSGKDVDEVVAHSKVLPATAVDLTAGDPVEGSAAPGGKLTVPVSVRNSGDVPVGESAVVFYNDYAIQADESFSNCLYTEGRLRSCSFDDRIEPGGSYVADMPYQLRADTLAPGATYGEVSWMTAAELDDYHNFLELNGIEPGTPGTGDALHLEEAAATRRGLLPPQADAHPDDNWSYLEIKVTGKNGADLAAFGSEATGAKGDEVTVTAGVRNVGKAAIDFSRLGSSPAVTAVYAPEGTSFKAIPEVCEAVEGKDDKVECWFDDYLIVPGDEATYEFKLHIDKVVANAKGAVVVNEPCECERFLRDINLANNKAVVLLNKAAPGGGGTGGGDGDDDPSLPVTGPAGTSAAILGLALLMLGAAMLFLTRRRDTSPN